MDPLLIVWGLCLIAALWFIPMGYIRMLAHRRGAADHGQGMLFVARMALTLGVIAGVAFIGLSVWMVART